MCDAFTILVFVYPYVVMQLPQLHLLSLSLSLPLVLYNVAGNIYSLECSAILMGSTNHPTITWLDPMNNQVPSEMVTTTGSTNTLTFSPLTASHAGTYTCTAMVGSILETATVVVTVKGECSVQVLKFIIECDHGIN